MNILILHAPQQYILLRININNYVVKQIYVMSRVKRECDSSVRKFDTTFLSVIITRSSLINTDTEFSKLSVIREKVSNLRVF